MLNSTIFKCLQHMTPWIPTRQISVHSNVLCAVINQVVAINNIPPFSSKSEVHKVRLSFNSCIIKVLSL